MTPDVLSLRDRLIEQANALVCAGTPVYAVGVEISDADYVAVASVVGSSDIHQVWGFRIVRRSVPETRIVPLGPATLPAC